MLDAARLFKLGLPTTVIVWDTFEQAAAAHAKLQGVPELPVVVIPHLKANETPVDQRRKAEEAVQTVISKIMVPIAEGQPGR